MTATVHNEPGPLYAGASALTVSPRLGSMDQEAFDICEKLTGQALVGRQDQRADADVMLIDSQIALNIVPEMWLGSAPPAFFNSPTPRFADIEQSSIRRPISIQATQ